MFIILGIEDFIFWNANWYNPSIMPAKTRNNQTVYLMAESKVTKKKGEIMRVTAPLTNKEKFS